MMPLDIFEIDNPNSINYVKKLTAEIGPSEKKSLISLDTKQTSESLSLLQFIDNAQASFFTQVFKGFKSKHSG